MNQELFPDSVRQNCGHPAVGVGGDGERRKRRRKEKEPMEAQGDAGGDGGGGERTGWDIREAEGSVGRDLTRTDSSEDEAAADETRRRRRMKTRCQDVPPNLDGESDDDFEDEDERGAP